MNQSSNPNAAQVRLSPASPHKTAGQRKHDLRIGKQPDYVAADRSPLNRVLIQPMTAAQMQARAIERRDRKPRKRAMKTAAAVSFSGIITFGHLAHRRFEQLTPGEQDAAFLDLAQAVANEQQAGLTGLVVHVDEAGLHAHFQLDAYDEAGNALSDKIDRAALRRVQDLTAEVMARHAPGIERGRGKVERLKAGAAPADVVYKVPAEMRRQLAQDLETAANTRTDLLADVAKHRDRIAKLEAYGDELTEKGAKQLETAQRRVAAKETELREVDAKIEAMEGRVAAAEKREADALERAVKAERGAQDAKERQTRAEAALEPLRPAYEALTTYRADVERAKTESAQQKPLADALDWLFEPARSNAPPEQAAKLMAQRIGSTAGIDEGELKFGGFDLDALAAQSDAAMSSDQFEAARIMAKTSDLWEAGVRYDPAFGRNRFTFDHKAINQPDLVKSLHRDSFDFRNAAMAIRDKLARVLPRIYAVFQGRALDVPMAPPEAAKPITSLPEELQKQVMDALAPSESKQSGPGR